MVISPIAIFAYNRPEALKRTISALKQCELADQSELFIFSDGAKKDEDTKNVRHVRDFSNQITGFKDVYLRFSDKNKGLANSIIDGVTAIFKENDSIIVVEDDLITSSNFISFMNQALVKYNDYQEVVSISGYNFDMKIPEDYRYDNFFTKRISSWGWGTWKNRWEEIDWTVSDYDSFEKNSSQKRKFNEMGSDLSGMLKKQVNGKIDSWAVRFCYHQFKHNLYSVFPVRSKISNDGFNDNATHTKRVGSRFETVLDDSGKTNFNFNSHVSLNNELTTQYIKNYSINNRVYHKLKNLFTSSIL